MWTPGEPASRRTKPQAFATGATALVTVLVVAVLSGCSASTSTSDGTKDPAAQAAKPATKPKTAAVPRLVSLTLAEAKASLREAGLTIGVVKREPSVKEAGTVLQQGASPGTPLENGSPVTIILAAPLPKVPDVVGSGKAAAVSKLEAAGFRVQTSTRSTTSGSDNVVLSEAPSAGSRVKPGTTVKLVISDLQKPRTLSSAGSSNCTPGYSPCLPPTSDYDCAGGSGDGPKYTGYVEVTGSDPYDLDNDGDGVACES
jgi:hypothetical protein